MSERKWTKGPVAVLVALDKHIKAERSLLYEASAREGEAASSIVIGLYEALQSAHMALIGYLPQHRNAITDAAIEQARAALQRAEGEV